MVLAVAQALYSSGSVILAATAGLVGAQLAPSKEWATLPVSAYVIGTMLWTIPAALIMGRIGRRAGFMVGAGVGAAAGLFSLYAIYMASFALFALSMPLHGVFQAFQRLFPLRRGRYGEPSVQAEGDFLGVDRRGRGGNLRHDDRDANDRPPGAGDIRRLLSRDHGTCACSR